MTDLKQLREWNTTQAETLEAMSDDDDLDAKAILNYRQNARILSVLERVREGCGVNLVFETQDFPDGTTATHSLKIDGPPDLLRELEEVLRRE